MMFALAIWLAPSALLCVLGAGLAVWDHITDRFADRSPYGGMLAYDAAVVPPPSVVVCERIWAAS